METYYWYQSLLKPEWAPPMWLFGPVWTLLYIGIAISFGTIFYQAYQRKIPRFVAVPFILNLIVNFSFTPIQFGLRNNFLAMIDILLVLGTLVWALLTVSQHKRWVAYINFPYLIWVMFATTLQISITILNW